MKTSEKWRQKDECKKIEPAGTEDEEENENENDNEDESLPNLGSYSPGESRCGKGRVSI